MPLPRNGVRATGKILAAAFLVVLLLGAVLAFFVTTFDWNRARPWVDEKVTQMIGRPFAINGDLRVGWQRPTHGRGWHAWVPWPQISAKNVTIDNTSWAKAPRLASADEVSFDVEVLPLLVHRIVVPSITLVNPSIDLERLADGRDNWTLNLAPSHGAHWTVRLSDLSFDKGNVSLSDEIKRLDLRVDLDTLGQPIAIGDVLKQQAASSLSAAHENIGKAARPQGASGVGASRQSAASNAQIATGPSAASAAIAREGAKMMPYSLGWTVQGSYQGSRVSGSGKLGSVLALRDPARPFPLQADVTIGDTRLALVGTLTDPVHLAALDLRLWLQGASLADLYPIVGIALPQTEPYATDGRLVGRLREGASRFTYSGFTGHMGSSDLNGTVTYQTRDPRPLITGAVISNELRFADLAPVVGVGSNAKNAHVNGAAKQPADRVIPVEAFHTDRWRAIDVDVKFTGRRIVKDPRLPITNLYVHFLINDGVLSLDPLRFGVAGGTLAFEIRLDGGASPLTGRVSMVARHLKLKQLFPTEKTMRSALGEINGDAALSATGNSPAALAASVNGEAKALVTQGTVSRLLMEEAGLNVANVVYEKLFGNRDVNIQCGAADFVATNGVLQARTFALDTDDALIGITGQIDLRNESMDLTVHPHTKGFRIFTLRSPLYVKGTFKEPDVGVDKEALALRAGAMLGLGLINPVAALVPLIAPSGNQQAPCGTLIAQMRAAPHAPAPGSASAPQPGADAAKHGTASGT